MNLTKEQKEFILSRVDESHTGRLLVSRFAKNKYREFTEQYDMCDLRVFCEIQDLYNGMRE